MGINEKMTAIANPIRELTNQAISLKLDDMASNLESCVDANEELEKVLYGTEFGGKSCYDKFWDDVQNNGASANYTRMFSNQYWTDSNFKPKYDMVASTMYQCFTENKQITAIDTKVDGTPLIIDGSNISATTGFGRTFYKMSSLQRIGLIISNADAPWVETFGQDSALTEVRFDGTIGSVFDIHWSIKLSRESLLSLLNVCNKQNAGITITLPAKCIDGKMVTETYIANDTELNTALTNAGNSGYTILFS